MRPARQGAFDGLCGLYAIINALDLVGLRQPRGRLHEQVFHHLTHALGGVALLRGMHVGLEPEDLLAAADMTFRWLEGAHGVSLTMRQPYLNEDFRGVRSFAKAVDAHTRSGAAAVILSYKTPHLSHWTVPTGLDGDRLLLRDSGGRRELHLPEFRLDRGPHRLRVEDTLLIERESET